MLPPINLEDFDIVATQLSIAKLFTQHLAIIAQHEHNTTHEEIYLNIEEAHLKLFNQNLPWTCYDSFRKWISRNRKEIYK